jgi:hypothetical protein
MSCRRRGEVLTWASPSGPVQIDPISFREVRPGLLTTAPVLLQSMDY